MESENNPVIVAQLPSFLQSLTKKSGLSFIQHDLPKPAIAPPVLPKKLKSLKFPDVSPLELARQITLKDYDLFAKIEITEFYDQKWAKDKISAPNLVKFIDNSNKVTNFHKFIDHKLAHIFNNARNRQQETMPFY